MKKRFCFFLILTMVLSVVSLSFAAGYTLPEKMHRQLQVGSGLKGSFVIHCNADPEKSPFIHSIQNAELEIRGIQSENNLHYYIYQPGEGEERKSLTEFCRLDGKDYLRSDLLGGKAYLLPSADHLVNSFLKSEGENPSVFPDLLRLFIAGDEGGEISFNTESFEKQIELWISSFTSETTVQTGENSSPKLSQVFRIPVGAMYNSITDLVKAVSSSDKAMSYLRSVLTEEQIDIYLNPNLAYYYLDAMNNLDMDGEIVFSRTVSTLGELINTSLVLPLDSSLTGYSSITFESDTQRKSVCLNGPKGVFYLNLPADTDFSAESYDNEEVYFVFVDHDHPDRQNLAVQIQISKKHEKYEDSEESRTNETDHYSIRAVRDVSVLPAVVSEEIIPDMDSVEAELEIHYSSKLQLSSPTTMEISCRIQQAGYDFSLTGMIKTASPWTFTPFDISDAAAADQYTWEDLEKLAETWMKQAEVNLIRTPEEIRQLDSSSGETSLPEGENNKTDDGTDEPEAPDQTEIPDSALSDTRENQNEIEQEGGDET